MSRSDCRKFSANIFNVSKCSHCFRQREEHSLAALECNRSTRKVTKCGYLFVAPDWDFITNPLYRTKRWQRRWFVLYDDGDLTYSVDEHPETIPQACIDMSTVVEVTWAEEITGHLYSLAIRCPDKVTFVKGTCSEESNWWFNVLAAFPKIKVRTKRNTKLSGAGMYGNQDKARFSLPDVENQREEKVPTLGTNKSIEEYFCKSSSRPTSLPISSNAPAIVSAIVKGTGKGVDMLDKASSPLITRRTSNHERGDPDGCNLDSETTANFMSESLSHDKKGWLMKLDNKSREWTKHWFSLRGAALFFYRDPNAEAKGVLDGVIDVNSLTEVIPVSVSRNYAFQLTTWEKNQITLSAMADSVRNDWIKLLRMVAGIASKAPEKTANRTPYELIESTSLEKDILLTNKSDDLKSEIEKDLMKTQQRYKDKNRIFALNKNLLQTFKGQAASVKATGTPPKINYSSDEEYGTASEGRHPDSFGFVSPMSPSSPVIETKERTSSRSSSRAGRFNKRSLSSPPSSRRSTMDSIRFDDAIISSSVDDDMEISSILRSRLVTVEKDLWMMREEAEERETRMTELLRTLDKTESELSTRIKEAEDARDCLAVELQEKAKQADALFEQQKGEIENYKQMIIVLEDRLSRGIEENDSLYKKLQEIENSGASSLCSLNRYKMKRVDSLSDLTNLNDIDPYSVERDALADEYRELKQRFEKAVNEIRLMKRELKESQNQFDSLEISYATLRNDIEQMKKDKQSQLTMMAARIQDLTFKYLSADRQNRVLKQKLAKTEKRRSLSLKGKEAFSIPKEFEEKLTELEGKIEKLEVGESSGQEHKGRSAVKMRRKSLDDDVNSVKPVEQILRLNSLERRVNNFRAKPRDSSTARNNRKMSEHSVDRLRWLEEVVVLALSHVEQSLNALQEPFQGVASKEVEKSLQDAVEVLRNACENCLGDSSNACEGERVKNVVESMEMELREKLSQLLSQRQSLRLNSQLTHEENMKLLAERVAFESVLFGKLHNAISRAETPSTCDDHLIYAEVVETVRLMAALRKKLDGEVSVASLGDCCADVLTNVLCRRLLVTGSRCRDDGECVGRITLPSGVIEDLRRQREDMQVMLGDFKAHAMDKLAIGLALETLDSISNNKAINEASQEAWQHAQMIVNSELIRGEISQVFRNCVNQYRQMMKPARSLIISVSEVKCFEHFADTVGVFLRDEVDSTLAELMAKHEEALERIQKGELERKSQSADGRKLLFQLADICAHRAIIDARISVLSGQYTEPPGDDMIPTRDTQTSSRAVDVAKYEDLFCQVATELKFNVTDLALEADWKFLGRHCRSVEEDPPKNASTMTEMELKSVSTESDPLSCDECEENREKLSSLGKQHEDSINDICQSYSYTVEVLKQKLEDEQQLNENYRSENMKIIQQLNELNCKREARKTELMEMTEKLNDISHTYRTKKIDCPAVSDVVDGRSPEEEYESEKSHLSQLEKHLKVVNKGDEEEILAPEKQEEDSLRKRYQSEIEQLRALCEKGLVAMESSHRRIISELEKKHQQELQQVLCEKEQALAEETQATLAALDAMRKAHQSEVQREIARFKQDFMKQFQKGGYNSMAMEHKEKEQELEEVRQEILSLSEKFSMKCVETASLEEKIQHLTRQLFTSQQQVQQLKSRDCQMESHLLSMKDERKLEESKNHEGESAVPNYAKQTGVNENTVMQKAKETHPRLKLNEGIKISPVIGRGSSATLIPLERMKTKVISTGNLSLRLSRNLRDLSSKYKGEVDDGRRAAGATGSAANPLCSPPPLNERDAEHVMRRFELEI